MLLLNRAARRWLISSVACTLASGSWGGISAAWAQPAAATAGAPSLLLDAKPSEAQPVPEAKPAEVVPPVVAQPADPLLDQVEEAIRVNGQRFLTANYHSPWQIFHGVLAYRRDFELKLGDKKIGAIDWIATADPRFDQQPLILVSPHGAKFHPFTRAYAFEGHVGQSLALLSESHLPVDFQFSVNGRKVTMGDMLQSLMMETNNREETTWVLWALINYLKVDAAWTNQHGQAWSIEALVQNEVNAHTPSRPCGGNHNLFALSRARDKYLKTGRPLRGVWMEADQKIRQYIELARSMQNSDGSFSSNSYQGPGFERDMNKRFNTTGHTMEFLSVGLPQSRLNEPWVRNAVNVLSHELIVHKKAAVDCGPLYHSLNALIIYRNRLRPTPTNPEFAGQEGVAHPLKALMPPVAPAVSPAEKTGVTNTSTAPTSQPVTPSGTPVPQPPAENLTPSPNGTPTSDLKGPEAGVVGLKVAPRLVNAPTAVAASRGTSVLPTTSPMPTPAGAETTVDELLQRSAPRLPVPRQRPAAPVSAMETMNR